MRNARRRRNISAVIALVALTTLAITIAIHERGTGPGAWFGVLLGAAFTGLFSVVAVLTFHLHVHWEMKLLSGYRLLAKWRVSPSEWAQFRANEKVRLDAGRQNSVKVRPASEAGGIDIIVAEDALMVDNDFFTLSDVVSLQYLTETPPVLEYNMVTRTKSGRISWNIRFPVAADANTGARAIWDYVYRPKPAVDMSHTIRKWRIGRTVGIVVALTSLPIAVFGWTNRLNGANQTVVLACLVVGLMGVPIGLFLAGLTHYLLRGERKRKTE